MTESAKEYVGRFAPSPTGPLHFGSLVAAVASYLDARSQQGKWLVRMEDLDRPREMPGAAGHILSTLEAYGFEWDGEVLYQSQRDQIYADHLNQLIQQELVYPCGCSRKEVNAIAHAGIEGPVYPGTCRHGLGRSKQPRAWRIRVPDNTVIQFNDTIQPIVSHQLQQDFGDFVLKRADGLFAYQLAVVVDDAEQGITHVVRGADLLNSTSRQIYLQRLFDFITPEYTHIPLVINAAGEKLSKQTHAAAISMDNQLSTLKAALNFLHMPVPEELSQLTEVWRWAAQNWSATVNNLRKLSH